jgi:hypothetical protein
MPFPSQANELKRLVSFFRNRYPMKSRSTALLDGINESIVWINGYFSKMAWMIEKYAKRVVKLIR